MINQTEFIKANNELAHRNAELEIDLDQMVQMARVSDQTKAEYEAYVEQLEMKVRELAALLVVMASRHILGRDPDRLTCDEASVKAMQLVTGAGASEVKG